MMLEMQNKHGSLCTRVTKSEALGWTAELKQTSDLHPRVFTGFMTWKHKVFTSFMVQDSENYSQHVVGLLQFLEIVKSRGGIGELVFER